uniref:BMA-SAX-7, isoform a n=1 Tax=Brugia malayi TaxID=6279 RepID=A0A1I9G781_BRUMA|nr:BMA-SAX-7, isoform a [Brugia malayi]
MVWVKRKKTSVTAPTTTTIAARCFTTLVLQLYILLTLSVVSIHIYSFIHHFQGTIYFHHIKESDFKPNRYYTCTAENTKLRDYKFGNQFRLDVTKNRRRALTSPIPPSEQYVNQSSPIALEGNTHKLHCFFSGYCTLLDGRSTAKQTNERR